jgi:hypothetical protein
MLAVSAVAAVAEGVAVVVAMVAAVVVMVSTVVVMAATAVALKIYYLWGDKDGYGSMFAVFVVFVVAAYSTRPSA